MSSLPGFAALSAVLVVIPGPAVMLVLKHALTRGRVPALFTAAGVLAADLVWALASVGGLTALLVSSQIAFDVVRYLGALYLIYLGVHLMFARGTLIAGDAREARDDASRPLGRMRHAGLSGFREGLFSDLSNPKTVIVFTSVIPQFSTPARVRLTRSFSESPSPCWASCPWRRMRWRSARPQAYSTMHARHARFSESAARSWPRSASDSRSSDRRARSRGRRAGARSWPCRWRGGREAADAEPTTNCA